jgi:hypothetical protein
VVDGDTETRDRGGISKERPCAQSPAQTISMSSDPVLEDLAHQTPLSGARGQFRPLIPPSNPNPLEIPSSDLAGAVPPSPSKPLSPPPSDTLVLLPEVVATGRPTGTKRPFQRRRRSRACDACRARKTKVLIYKLMLFAFVFMMKFFTLQLWSV